MPELPEVQAHAERLDGDFAGGTVLRVPADHLHGPQDLLARPRRGPPASRSCSSAGGASTCSTSARPPSSSTSCRAAASSPTPSSRPSRAAAWPAGASTTVGPCCSPRPARSARPGCGWSTGDPEASRRSTTSGPRPTSSTAAAMLALLHEHPMRLHGSCATSGSSPASAGASPTRSATGRSCRPSPTPASSSDDAAAGWSRRSGRASPRASPTSGAATTCRRRRSAPGRARPGGRAVPGVRRHGAVGRVHALHGRLLPTCQTGGKVLADNTTSKFLK